MLLVSDLRKLSIAFEGKNTHIIPLAQFNKFLVQFMVLIELLRKGNIIKQAHIETMLTLRYFNVMTLYQR